MINSTPITMETQTQTQILCEKKPNIDHHHHSTIDTSRPFRSVKEAVAIFGERLLVGEIYSPKPYLIPNQEIISWSFSSPNPNKITSTGDEESKHSTTHDLVDSLKKLEAELEETKVELKLLKERESETEVALASLNAELHKNMSKMAKAEAATAAAKAVAVPVTREYGLREEEMRRRDKMERMDNNNSPTLAEILSVGDQKQDYFGRKEKKMMKKKPIIPLVGDLFSRKKVSSTTLHNPLYSSSPVSLN